MERVIKKYKLTGNQQALDDKRYWENQSAEHKIEVLESLREDAFKLGIYTDKDECRKRLRRVLRITKQK